MASTRSLVTVLSMGVVNTVPAGDTSSSAGDTTTDYDEGYPREEGPRRRAEYWFWRDRTDRLHRAGRLAGPVCGRLHDLRPHDDRSLVLPTGDDRRGARRAQVFSKAPRGAARGPLVSLHRRVDPVDGGDDLGSSLAVVTQF